MSTPEHTKIIYRRNKKPDFQAATPDSVAPEGVTTNSEHDDNDTKSATNISDIIQRAVEASLQGQLSKKTNSPDTFLSLAQKLISDKEQKKEQITKLETEFITLLKSLGIEHCLTHPTNREEKYVHALYQYTFKGVDDDVTTYEQTMGFPPRNPNTVVHLVRQFRVVARKYLKDLATQKGVNYPEELIDYLQNKKHTSISDRLELPADVTTVKGTLQMIMGKTVSAIQKAIEKSPVAEHLNETDIFELLRKIAGQKKEFQGVVEISKYSALAAAHLAHTEKRFLNRAPIILQEIREEEREIAENIDRERQYLEEFRTAKEEYIQIMNAYSNPKKKKYIELLYYSLFERENDQQLEQRYPNTSRDVRDKYRQRARKLLQGKVSPNLQKFLDKRLNNRPSNT